MRIAVTGAGGFLGWHTLLRFKALTTHEVVPITRSDWLRLPQLLTDVDIVVHLAGVNRGTDSDLLDGNIELAERVAQAALASERVRTVVFANSIQAGNATAYGRGKQLASEILKNTMKPAGRTIIDIRFPNLFGAHGRPSYNSFVSTFAHAVVNGQPVKVTDREIALMHVQDAAQVILDSINEPTPSILSPAGESTSVTSVLETLRNQFSTYKSGDIPVLATRMDLNLFNTLRAAMFPERYPIVLTRHSDMRGSLTEVVRARGSEGQTFVSVTRTGVTRGQHFHLRKFERFVVVAGRAEIALRKLFTDEIVRFQVTGDAPSIVDMPIGWAHSITNTGTSDLLTVFWSNEIFDPLDTDTFPEEV